MWETCSWNWCTRSRSKPWPEGHRISDQGILNIAFGYRRMRAMMDSYRSSRSGGARANGFPLHAINWGVVYVNDEQEFSVELLWVNPRWDARMGFTPLPMASRPLPDTHRVERTVSIAAPVDRVWDIVADHRGDEVVLRWTPSRWSAKAILRRTASARTRDAPDRQVLGWQPGHSIIGCWKARDFLPPGSRRVGEPNSRGASGIEQGFRHSGIVRRAIRKMLVTLPRLKDLAEPG
jgi:hypothetical protein